MTGRLPERSEAALKLLVERLRDRAALDPDSDLENFARLFDDGLIYDWNACDWLCAKVLGPSIRQKPEAWARRVAEWRDADNPWRARASVVA